MDKQGPMPQNEPVMTMQQLSVDELDAIRRTSIRGRMALALRTLERMLDHFGIQNPVLDSLIDALWGFVEASNLAAWEQGIRQSSLADLIDLVDFGRQVPPDTGLPELPAPVLRAIYEIFAELAEGEMYGGVVGFSQPTSDATVRVVQLARDEGVPLPRVEPYPQLAPFSEKGGWGRPTPRSVFPP